MSKKVTGFIFAAGALLLLAVLAYTNLEIRPRTVFVPPSREARVNNFFALEKWLARTGHPVRFLKRGSPGQITGAPEKTVFLQASVFDWEDAAEPLKNWIAAGGFLLVSLEPFHEDAALDAFLAGFGIEPAVFENPAADAAAGAEEEHDGGGGLEYEEAPPPEPVPDFDQLVRFTVSEETAPPVFTIKEGEDIIRLVRVPLEAGAAVFTGRPVFMENDYLEREVNARLAWDLTGGRTGDNPGLLFIRGRRQVKSLFGKLADRGNLLPLGLSLLLLIITGFWMVLPPFGLLLQEKEPSVRPIRERFLAEIRFLKKYHALETYLEAYIHEIRRKLRNSQGNKGAFPDEVEKTLKTRGRLPYKELIQNLQKLGTMMERL
ncbi:MAG: hypothetical protein LBG10_03800 [Treponema sp.]|jgi:hypothetical protein|nr:hypothetical protein [Treponema sp.]